MYKDPIEELIELINEMVSDKDTNQETLVKLDNHILLDLDRLIRMSHEILIVLKEINNKLSQPVAVSATISFGSPTNNK